MYKRVYIDLYVETEYGADVIHTINLVDIENPKDDPIVRESIVKIYTYMKQAKDAQFSCIRVGGVVDLDVDEEELFYVYKHELVKNYGVNILEYSSIWKDVNICV